MTKFILDKNNFQILLRYINKASKSKLRTLEIYLTADEKKLPKFSGITKVIYKALDYESVAGVWLINFPFCVFNFHSRDHILNDKKYSGGKLIICKKCKYDKICSGFPKGYFNKFGKSEIAPVKDLPIEVMIEVETECNFKCNFCFNKISFAKDGRNSLRLSQKIILKAIDDMVASGIKIIRFTGGEPLLRKDIFLLMKYAKNKKVEVRLNTNGSLITEKAAKKLSSIVDNVLIPIESWNNKTEDKLTGYKNSLDRKIKSVSLLHKAKIPIVRVGTVATKNNIKNFSKLSKLILKLPINEWEFYRPVSNGNINSSWSKQDADLLVKKVYNQKRDTNIKISIANAFPFCATSNINKTNSVSIGAVYDEGNNRLVIDPGGFYKPYYYMDINLGSCLDIKEAWNHPFLVKMRNLFYLPKKCSICRYRFKCLSGSRFEAKIMYGNWLCQDPLTKSKN